MSKIYKYLDSLEKDKQLFVDILNEKGILAEDNETFTQLVPKVDNLIKDNSEEIYDVIMIDYDGEILYKYSVDEFMKLKELPLPETTHENLTFQGWNWTLEDAKEFMQDRYNALVIGALYCTTDGTLTMKIKFEENDYRDPEVRFYAYPKDIEFTNGDYSIDWGDGTVEQETFTLFSSVSSQYGYGNINKKHSYKEPGEYTIKIKLNENFMLYSNESNGHYPTYLTGQYINSNSFSYYPDKVTELQLPENFCFIGGGSISQFNKITKINTPNSLHIPIYLREYYNAPWMGRTYFNLNNIKCIIINNGIDGIENTPYSSSFTDIPKVEYISLPKSFINASRMQKINATNLKYITTITPQTFINKGTCIISNLLNIRKFKIPNGTVSISSSDYSFYNNRFIKELFIPASVTKLNPQSLCTNCNTHIIFEDSKTLKEINNAFYYNYEKYFKGTITYNGFRDLTLANLSGMPIDELDLTNLNVTSISVLFCNKLKRIIGIEKLTNTSISTRGCTSLEEMSFPDTVTMTTEYQFKDCISLKKVILPINQKSKSSYTWDGADNLDTIIYTSDADIPNQFLCNTNAKNIIITGNVKVIKGNNFFQSSNLKYIKFPSTLTTMNSYTMYYCYNLRLLDFTDCLQIPTIENNFLDYCNKPTILVPKELFNSWIVASYWKNFKSYIYYIDDDGNYSQEEVVE